MAIRVQVTGGPRPTAFAWGTVSRKASRVFMLEPQDLQVLERAKNSGLIQGFEVLDGPAAPTQPKPLRGKPEAAVVADEVAAVAAPEVPAPVTAPKDPLAELYSEVFHKALEGEIDRKDLVALYQTVLGREPGKKRTATLKQELVDACAR